MNVVRTSTGIKATDHEACILRLNHHTSPVRACEASLYQHAKVFQKLDKTAKRWYLMVHPCLHVALFMDTIGLLLLGIGLFSSQWICFLVVLVMSFSQIQKLGAWAVFLDSLVTVIIYAFAILNAYHLA